ARFNTQQMNQGNDQSLYESSRQFEDWRRGFLDTLRADPTRNWIRIHQTENAVNQFQETIERNKGGLTTGGVNPYSVDRLQERGYTRGAALETLREIEENRQAVLEGEDRTEQGGQDWSRVPEKERMALLADRDATRWVGQEGEVSGRKPTTPATPQWLAP
ncbi:unnamed protein product, partial [marine sediment metagenome]